jgi:deoxycytidylate deaminase
MASEYIVNLLVETASKSAMAYKYACIITYQNKVIACGYNKYDVKYSLEGSCLLRA